MSTTAERENQLVRGVIVGVIAKGGDSFQIEVREEGSQYTRKIWTKDEGLVRTIHGQGVGQAFDFMCNVSHWRNSQGQPVRSLWLEDNGMAVFGSLQAPAPAQQAQPPGLPGMGQGGLPVQGGGLPGQGAPPLAQGWAPAAGPGPLPNSPAPGLPGSGYPPQALTPPTMAPALPPQQADPQWQQIPPVIREERIMRMAAMKCASHIIQHLPPEQQNLSGLEFVSEWFVRYFIGGPQSRGTVTNQPPAQTNQSDGGAPDWVAGSEPVPGDYFAGADAQPGFGAPPAPPATPPGAYSGGFPS